MKKGMLAQTSGLSGKQQGEAVKAFNETYKATGDASKAMDAMASKTTELGGRI